VVDDGLAGTAGKALLDAHDVALLDLDGVVYVGDAAVPHAAQALAGARLQGLRLAFVTNNASRTPDDVAGRLTAMGVPAAPEEVVTSAQAAAHVVADRVPPGSRVLAVGAEGLLAALRERGLRPVASADDGPVAVVQGYGPEVGWRALAEASVAVRRGALWVATNTDTTIPTPRGPAPGNGALVECVRLATGAEPLVTGKPETAMHREAVERARARRPLVVGDRLDTDMEGARRARVPALLVLTGVDGPLELLGALPSRRPQHVAADLRGLLSAHPTVVREGAGRASCGSWRASYDRGELSLHERAGPPDPSGLRPVEEAALDALRAACGAVWSGPGSPPLDLVGVAAALEAVGVRTGR
jgi:HAD superfamily hydrolase (TIGR01450 family)